MANPLEILERLREGTESQRRRFAYISAFSITGIIFVAWLMSFTAGPIVYSQASGATTSPLAAIGDVVKQGNDIMKTFKDFISEARSIFTASSSPTTFSNVDSGGQGATSSTTTTFVGDL